MDKNNFDDIRTIWDDPVFSEIFLPLYQSYKKLDRGFDKKVIDKDLENLRIKFLTISGAKERRRPKSS